MPRLNGFDLTLLIYCSIGLAATAFIVDEFDVIRLAMVTFVGLPGLIFWLFMRLNYPETLVRFARASQFVTGCIIAIFSWGNILLLNAVGDGQEQVQVAQQIGTTTGNVAHQRGPLGIIYRPRF